MEQLRSNHTPRLLLAGSLLAATACINIINVQVHAVMPEMAQKTRITRTATVAEPDKDVEELLKNISFDIKVAHNEPEE